MIHVFRLGGAMAVSAALIVACANTDNNVDDTPKADTVRLASRPDIGRMVPSGNLFVNVRPDDKIPDGYAFTGKAPKVAVDHEAGTISISGFYVFEASAEAPAPLRQADFEQRFAFGPPEPKVYKIIYDPKDARAPLARGRINFGPRPEPTQPPFRSIPPLARISHDPDTKTITVTLRLSRCIGRVTEPLDDDLMVGVNHRERKILVFGTFRFSVSGGELKYCRMDPENPKRVFQFENAHAGDYEIIYARRGFSVKRNSWPRRVDGQRAPMMDLSIASADEPLW